MKILLAALATTLLCTHAMANSQDALFDTPLTLITNPSKKTPEQTPVPNVGAPLALVIQSVALPNNKYPVVGIGGCYEFEGDVNVNTTKRQLRDFNLKLTKIDYDCENATDFTIEGYAFELLKSVYNFEVKNNKVQMKNKSARPILWFGLPERA